MFKWNSQANKAAIIAIPVTLFAVGMLALVFNAIGATMTVGIALVAFFLIYGFAFSAVLKGEPANPDK